MRRLAAILLCLGCGSSGDGSDAAEVVGVWVQCQDAACDVLADDGFKLSSRGNFRSITLESRDEDGASYCEASDRSGFDFEASELTITPERTDDNEQPRTVRFEVDGDRATLIDENGTELSYLRLQAESSGLCPGVQTDL